MPTPSDSDQGGLHPSLKAKALEAAARFREYDVMARSTPWCEYPDHPRDCPGHSKTIHETWVEAKAEDYRRLMDALRNETEADFARHLVRAGCNELHINLLRKVSKGGKKLEQRPPMQAARFFLEQEPADRRSFLLLAGPTDTGKTLAATAILWAKAKKFPWNSRATGTDGDPFVFVRASVLARLSAYDSDARAFEAKCHNARALVIDDLGTEHLSPVGESILSELVDVRYGKPGCDTVFTTNLELHAFAERYDGRRTDDQPRGRIARRIRERGLVLNNVALVRDDTVVKRFEKWKPTVVDGGKEKKP